MQGPYCSCRMHTILENWCVVPPQKIINCIRKLEEKKYNCVCKQVLECPTSKAEHHNSFKVKNKNNKCLVILFFFIFFDLYILACSKKKTKKGPKGSEKKHMNKEKILECSDVQQATQVPRNRPKSFDHFRIANGKRKCGDKDSHFKENQSVTIFYFFFRLLRREE